MSIRLAILVVAALISGCTTLWHDLAGRRPRQGISSSLVDYLYPNGEVPPEQDNVVPNLQLPVKVGLAFVPSIGPFTYGLSEARKNELLGNVKGAFANREFIREITVVPDTYLRSRKGFQTVDQVVRLYGLDVMVLVSYDQVASIEDTKASLLYWTIVGAYLIKGSKNDVQTFVDAAVFDVKSHKLLLRAPGIDRIESTSTLINIPEEARKAREHSFDNAMASMTKHLDDELEVFRERIKTDRSVIVTQRADSRGGGGALGAEVLGLMTAALAAAAIRRTSLRTK
jgi:rhombotail lipoprotein